MSKKKHIVMGGTEYHFQFSESAQCWIGKIQIHEYFITLELYLSYFPSNEINWDDVTDFYNFISRRINLYEITQKGESLLLNFIDTVRFGIDEDISRYSFKLAAILYQGKKHSSIFGSETYHYSMLFKLYNVKYAESDDPYGNYHVDVDKGHIYGLRREQT